MHIGKNGISLTIPSKRWEFGLLVRELAQHDGSLGLKYPVPHKMYAETHTCNLSIPSVVLSLLNAATF